VIGVSGFGSFFPFVLQSFLMHMDVCAHAPLHVLSRCVCRHRTRACWVPQLMCHRQVGPSAAIIEQEFGAIIEQEKATFVEVSWLVFSLVLAWLLCVIINHVRALEVGGFGLRSSPEVFLRAFCPPCCLFMGRLSPWGLCAHCRSIICPGGCSSCQGFNCAAYAA
jgi:hypothetical protein